MSVNSQPWDYFPLLTVYAFTSKKKARKFVRKKTGLDYTFIGKSGQCTFYESDRGGGFCVILLRCDDVSTQQKYAILAHECVHYTQYYEESTGGKLDTETAAYATQSAMLACVDQIGEEWFNATPQT